MVNIKTAIQNAYEQFGSRNFVFTKRNGQFESISYAEFIEKSDALAHFMLERGLAGKNIMVIGQNSVEYMMADLAITAYVGACVNVNPAVDAESLARIIEKGKVAVIFYSAEMKEKIAALKVTNLHTFELQATISSLQSSTRLFDFVDKDPDICSKIIFTSGTTSAPKGVMLSLCNIFAGWKPLYDRTGFGDNGIEVVYVFLPLSHTYCDIYNFLYSFMYGPELYLCSDTDKIGQELLEVRPTAFCAVPIIYRRLYDYYGENIAQAFGDRIKYLYVGGAVFDKKLRAFYRDHGVPILEAYALTEVASSFAVDYPNPDDLESTGTIYENIDAQIRDPDACGVGSIVVKGDNVFMGYIGDAEKTRAAFTKDGYFITGDYGRIEDNKIYVMGRDNDVVVGENGENVYLAEILVNLNKIDELVAKVTATVKDDGLLHFVLYVSDDAREKIPALIEKYNASAIKKDRIDDYELVSSAQIKFK